MFKTLTDEKKPDYSIFFLSSALIIISIIFSYSLSIYTVVYWDYSQFHFFSRQLFTGILSILIMWSLSYISPNKLIDYLGWSLLIVFLLLIISMPFLPASFVTESGGAKRWIRFPGISLAPIEFFKVGFIYFLARSFSKHVVDKQKNKFLDELILLYPYAIIFAIVVGLIAVLQKDLGQVVLLGTILFVMLIFSNRSWKLFISIISVAIIGVIALILQAPHRINRIKSWWSMVQDNILSIMPDSIANTLRVENFPEPYQVSNSLNAIHNGGFFGTGLGEGSLKLGFLSEVHTDFVLAGITEEIGLVGLAFVLAILFTLIYKIFQISQKLKKQDTKYHLFTLGIGLMISIAFLINSYGISGIIPIKGIAVPFLSYGGSSMLGLSIAIGMVLSISRLVNDEIKPKQ